MVYFAIYLSKKKVHGEVEQQTLHLFTLLSKNHVQNKSAQASFQQSNALSHIESWPVFSVLLEILIRPNNNCQKHNCKYVSFPHSKEVSVCVSEFVVGQKPTWVPVCLHGVNIAQAVRQHWASLEQVWSALRRINVRIAAISLVHVYLYSMLNGAAFSYKFAETKII